jgi:hypothetical protein
MKNDKDVYLHDEICAGLAVTTAEELRIRCEAYWFEVAKYQAAKEMK